jgi:DICT domain-containing protein
MRLINHLVVVIAAGYSIATIGADNQSGARNEIETGKDSDPRARVSAECDLSVQCKRLATCAEARDYLTRCGADHLDRDHDGIPCESLCGKK